MLLVKLNGVDITEKVDYNTVKITEQMNNRSNTCSFTVSDIMVPEGAILEIWEGSELTQNESSGQPTIHVDDTFEYFIKYRVGDEIKIPAGSTSAITRVIDSIDHTLKTITFTANLPGALTKGDKIGRLIFAGVTLRNPDDEIGKSWIFIYRVQAVDFTKLFDAKNVVDTFEDQYPREVIGRIVHKFTATDSFLEITPAESTTGWSNTGVARTPGTSSTDKVWQSNSITGWATGAGTVTYRFTPTVPVDISAFTHLRPWVKIDAGELSKLTAPKFRAMTSGGNYLEWTDAIECEDCWSYESFKIADGTATGTVNLASIAYFEYQWTASTSVALGGILFDQLSATTGGFTIRNVMRGDTLYADIRAQYKKPTVLLESLAKLQQLYWYVDYERDVHFFEQESYDCPMEILDDSEVYNDLSITADISQLKNRQVVRGGEAVDSSLYTQDEVTDGKMESWRLDYKPKTLKIYVDTTGTGSSYVEKTVGIENLDDATAFDYLFNFNEKIVKRASAPLLAAGTLIRRTYYPYRPIRVQVEDSTSILAMKALLGGDGIYDGAVVNDESIRDFEDARNRARAEIAPYKNPVITATWTSEQDGWKAGQIVHIQDTNRGVDDSYVIQKVQRTQNTTWRWIYQIMAGTTMFGLIEFFQLLLSRTDKLLIDVSEIVDIVKTVDETIIMTEGYTSTGKERPFFATPLNPAETLKIWQKAIYKFEGNGNDSSGNGYNATASGAVSYGTDATGPYVLFSGDRNHATWPSGTSAALTIGNVMNYTHLTDYSWSATFSLTTLPANNGAGIFGSGFDNSVYVTSAWTMSVSLRGSTSVFIGCGPSAYWATRLGQVHTVSYKYDAATAKAYVWLDWILQNAGGTAGPSTFLCNEWSIGDNAIGGGNLTSCIKKVYSVRVYDKELTDQEVLWIANKKVFEITDPIDRHTHLSGNLKYSNVGLTINGTDQYVTDYFGNISSSYQFDWNDMNTQAWFFTGMGQEFTMAALITPTTVTGAVRRILISTNDRLGFHLDTLGRFLGYVYDTNYRTITLASTATAGTSYHVCLTYKLNTLTFYIDGISQGTLAVTGPIVTATDVYIGNWSSLAQGFIGKIDEWEFSTTARDAAGVLELYKRCTVANDAYADYCEAS